MSGKPILHAIRRHDLEPEIRAVFVAFVAVWSVVCYFIGLTVGKMFGK